MTKLQQQNDSTNLLIAGLGAQLRVEVVGATAVELTSQLRNIWSRCIPTDAPSGDIAAVETLTVELGDGPVTWELLERTTQRITVALLNQQAGKALLLHAGGVSHPVTGRCVVYVAPSQVGKTTLSLELAQHFGYLSDESIAITEDLEILPYPKPLSVRDPYGGPRKELGPDALGLRVPPAHPQLTNLLILDRQEDHAGPPEIEELDVFEVVALLGPQTSWLSSLPAGLHRLDLLLQLTGGALKVTYREAASLLPLVIELLGDPAEADFVTPVDSEAEAFVQLIPPVDQLIRDGETLLQYRDRVVQLGALGTAVVAESIRPITVQNLTQRLIAALGSPETGDANAATLAAVEHLVEQGVLRKI